MTVATLAAFGGEVAACNGLIFQEIMFDSSVIFLCGRRSFGPKLISFFYWKKKSVRQRIVLLLHFSRQGGGEQTANTSSVVR